jgi:hypothetical protein
LETRFMEFRRKFALLFSAAGCAFALMFPAPMPGLGFSEIGSPPHIGSLASAENLADGDTTMAALRQQANAALASLQAAAAEHL